MEQVSKTRQKYPYNESENVPKWLPGSQEHKQVNNMQKLEKDTLKQFPWGERKL